jgi:hypothetical protein
MQRLYEVLKDFQAGIVAQPEPPRTLAFSGAFYPQSYLCA